MELVAITTSVKRLSESDFWTGVAALHSAHRTAPGLAHLAHVRISIFRLGSVSCSSTTKLYFSTRSLTATRLP